uniref:Polycystin-1 n=1 Tax=Phallusia mammillata TaxID=59560 RepID=A0A6F9DPI6_9ASCI|nr:polycystin-1 [Phallusia mammillata]
MIFMVCQLPLFPN